MSDWKTGEPAGEESPYWVGPDAQAVSAPGPRPAGRGRKLIVGGAALAALGAGVVIGSGTLDSHAKASASSALTSSSGSSASPASAEGGQTAPAGSPWSGSGSSGAYGSTGTGGSSRPSLPSAAPSGTRSGAFGDHVVGTIKSISGSTLTITTQGSSTKAVTTTSSTKVTAASSGSLSDVAVGDHVAVMTSSSKAASTIIDSGTSALPSIGGPFGGAAPFGGHGLPGHGSSTGGTGYSTTAASFGPFSGGSGTVSALGKGTVTVTSSSGSKTTYTTSGTTQVTILKSIAVSNLKAGESVAVTTASSDSSTATTILEGTTPFGVFWGGPGGMAGMGGPGGMAGGAFPGGTGMGPLNGEGKSGSWSAPSA